MKRIMNIEGLKFNYLTIIEIDENFNKNSGRYWKCKCICGSYRSATYTALKNGLIKSCGCMAYKEKHANQKFEPQEASFRAKATNYKALAKLRNIIWDLSIEECVFLLKGNCYYCKKSPSNKFNVINSNRGDKYLKIEEKEKYNINYNGIDRKNNNIGYKKNNVVSCCSDCNTAKLEMTIEDFKYWVKRLYKNINNW